MTPNDDLERHLRDVLHSRKLSISPPPDAIARIHAGAKRRRRRQHAITSGVAAVAVVGIALSVAVLRPTQNAGTTIADGRTGTPTLHTTADTKSAPTPSPAPSERKSASAPPTASTLGAPISASTIPGGGAPPTDFVPISVTAVNARTFWVLGHAACGVQTCTGIAKSTDAGKTFTEVGAPASTLVPDVPGPANVFGVNTISDIRFVDAKNGWAFGGGLWQTNDAGDTWSFVAVPGAVQRLEVASGRAWAIVLADASAATGPTYDVYSSTYPGGSWQKASSAGVFGPAEPKLAVQGTTATVIGTDAVSGAVRAVQAGIDATFTALGAPPCAGALGEPLSSSATSLWLACTSSANKLPGVFFSSDFGKSWQVSASKLDATTVAIGAVDSNSAIVSDGGKLVRHTASQSVEAVSQPPLATSTVFAFVGFTTPAVGFAIPETDNGRQLWRTDDGGAHWAIVKI